VEFVNLQLAIRPLKEGYVVIKRILLALILLFTLLIPWFANANSARAPKPFVIRNVRLFDGERTIPKTDVVVADGKIKAVGPAASAPAGTEVIDGSGDTLLPGLIDSHVHLWNHYELRQALIFGNTTVLDMLMWWQNAQKWKAEEANGASDIADFRTAGFGFATPGGHGDLSPAGDDTITKPEQAQQKVDQRIVEGSDYIKVFYNNGPRFPAIPKPVLEAIVKAAHKRGKMVVVHGTSLDIPDAGADGLAHLPIDELHEPEWTDALMAHHMFVITTMTYNDFHLTTGRLAAKLPDDPRIRPYLGPTALLALLKPRFHNSDTEHLSLADSETNLRALREAGVPILAGTDAIDVIGALLHVELELMVKAGIPPSEALADATSVPARIFSLNDRGRIAPGLRADLLLVRGDPTTDIRQTRDIVTVWKQGVRVDRDAFRKEVASQNAAEGLGGEWKVADENAAWTFGTGWMPAAGDGSAIHMEDGVDQGHNSRPTMILTGVIKPGAGFLFAGAQYRPALEYENATDDVSGTSNIAFRARGDGKTYTLSLFDGQGRATTKYFIAGKDWSEVSFPFSSFGSEGKDVARVQIASSVLGPFHIELADPQIGSHRWLGLMLDPKSVKIDSVAEDSPAQQAGLKKGDVIVAMNQTKVTSYRDVLNFLGNARAGDKVNVEVVRDGKPQTLQVIVAGPPYALLQRLGH
jgi:imidazolonepropionase-like amidohydrolase